jgi:hypothetical protein
MLRFLDGRCEHGETVMPQTMDDRLGSPWVNPIVALTRCRIPNSDIFSQSFITKEAYQQRDSDVIAIKTALRAGETPTDELRKYHISLLHLECPTAPCLSPTNPAFSTLIRLTQPHVVAEIIEVKTP